MSKFCVLPFVHFEVDTDGKIRPCCVYDGHYLKDDGSHFNARTDSIHDIRNSTWIKNMQDKMLADKPDSGCRKCYSEEANGNVSRRMRENERYAMEIDNIKRGEFNLKIIDIKPGNTCNLKCRICNEFSSSKWIDDKKKLFNTNKVFSDSQLANFKWYNNDKFWEELDTMMEHVEAIEIFGGEPMLIKQQFQFLERLIARGLSKNITVSYATNGTIFPEHAVKNIWPHFKHITIMLSADGVREGFEYSRYPAEWSVYEDTLQRYVNAGITPTISYGVSVYSIFNLIESLEYYYEKQIPVWLNIVYDANTSIAALPKEVKNIITDRIENEFLVEWNEILQEKTIDGVVNYMNNTQMDFLNVRKDINQIDKIREQNFNDVFSGLEGYLNGD
jgi:MoaA/NifB/PqqE/SkfB family radical SAM enzyme